MRISGSDLCTLHSGAPPASRKACTCCASGEPSPPLYPTPSSTTPTSSIATNRPLAGTLPADIPASPANPAAATRQVARMATDPVTRGAPAVALGATNGVQLSVPRSTSNSDDHWVVTPEDSMKSRNGGLIRAIRISATTHQVMASANASNHHPV